MSDCADLELSLRRQAGGLAAELRFIPAGSNGPVRLLDGPAPLVQLDEAALLAAQLDPASYGAQLSAMLWADQRLPQAIGRARALAEGAGTAMRLRLLLDDGEPALHAIHWETLGDPTSPGRPLLAASGRLRFSRFLGSSDLQPLRPRPRADLRALVVVANPEDLDAYQLGQVDVAGELDRARAALDAVPLRSLAGAAHGGRATLAAITQALREGPDILYLVAHGTLHRGTPYLWLEDDDGLAARVGARALVEQIQSLSIRPLLVVLGSCQSAGNGAAAGALSALGPQLAAAGIAAVVAMQGNVAQAAVARFIPAFLGELLRDGAVDRAAAAGRAALVAEDAWWQPVLWMRAIDGRLWSDEPPPAAAPPREPPTNLPGYTTRLVGREGDVTALAGLVLQDSVRLVTILGPGGIGKTRLAVQAGWELRDAFADGVFFVDLTDLRAAEQVLPAIATALGLKEEPERPLAETIGSYLRPRRLLLILDTFERLLAAAPVAGRLLAAAPDLRLLVTSRAALRVGGEYEYPIDPLALIDLALLPQRAEERLAALADNPAIALFVERANAVKPGFALSEANAELLVRICDQLDGLPLAIELAAVRIKLLSPQALLARLGNRLGLLTGGARDLATHQQTLRSTIAWSYDMLEPLEQRLFAHMAVFVGGCSFAAVEAVCGAVAPGQDLLDPLSSLVDKNLIRQSELSPDEPRFSMLSTIREFAGEQLAASAVAADLQLAHADFYRDLAQAARQDLQGPGQRAALGQLEREHDNLRAALAWALAAPDPPRAGGLADALFPFWYICGYMGEGRGWLARMIGMSEAVPAALRAQVQYGAGVLAMAQADYAEADERFARSLAIYRELGDRQREIGALQNLGNVARRRGDLVLADAHYAAALDLCRAIGAMGLLLNVLMSLAGVCYQLGALDQAEAYNRECLELARAAGRQRDMAYALNNLWLVALQRGQLGEAALLLDAGQALYRELHDQVGIAAACEGRGRLALREGHYAEAQTHLTAGLKIAAALGDRQLVAECLERLADLALRSTNPQDAVRRWGAAAQLRQIIGAPLAAVERPAYNDALAAARDALGAAAFEALWAAAANLNLDEAVAAALAG